MPKITPDAPPRKKRVAFQVDEATYELLNQAAVKGNQSVASFAREATINRLRELGYLFG